MNAQEIFNKVATHLFAQGEQAMMKRPEGYGEVCAYRSPGGNKCAVGCLIPDAEYKPEMENSGVGQVMSLSPFMNTLADHEELLDWLQDNHDNDGSWISTEAMREALADTASNFRLDASILATLSFNR